MKEKKEERQSLVRKKKLKFDLKYFQRNKIK